MSGSRRQTGQAFQGPDRRVVVVSLFFLFVTAILGCSVLKLGLGQRNDAGLKFSHARHAKHVSDCKSCHFDANEEEVVAATHRSCVQCHSAAAETLLADDSCLLCHRSLPPIKAARSDDRPDYSLVQFDHESHDSLSCAVCHPAYKSKVNRAGIFSKSSFPRMEDCLACHFPRLAETSSADCFICHAALSPQTLPKSHEQADWQRIHGFSSITDPALCARCHQKARDCDACHLRERPQTHTAVFRGKTHGFHAINNPMSCATCHTQTFCQECHLTTEPRNHTRGFKRRPYIHCATCHLPLEEGNRCAVCHTGDPHERVIARPPPAALVANGEIRRPPSTHPYNTISPFECVQCHRPL